MAIDPFLNLLPRIITNYSQYFAAKDLQDLETTIASCETDPASISERLLEWLQDHEDFFDTLLDFVEGTRQLGGGAIPPVEEVQDAEIITNYFTIFKTRLHNINQTNGNGVDSPKQNATSP